MDHTEQLLDKIRFANNNEDIYDKVVSRHNISRIEGKIKEVLVGEVVDGRNEKEYQMQDKSFKLSTIASGLKSYVIIRILLDHGYLKEGSLLVIDEPEVHLHPEWQVKFAELIVLIMKELKIKILLATHSPFFLEAIEIFSKKYQVMDKTHYYLAERKETGAVFKSIDSCLEETYQLLAEPIITMQHILDDIEDEEQ